MLSNDTNPLPPRDVSPSPQNICHTLPLPVAARDAPIRPIKTTLQPALPPSVGTPRLFHQSVASSQTPTRSRSQSLAGTSQSSSQLFAAPSLCHTQCPTQSQPNMTKNVQNNSRSPHRTLPDSHSDHPKSAQVSCHNITHNATESASFSALHPAMPLISSPHPDPLLVTSMTFTSSASSNLFSPFCSSSASFPCSPEAQGLPTLLPVTPHLSTPPPPKTPPPLELTPPPTHLLGSDDEEQEDPSDYCKGRSTLRSDDGDYENCISDLVNNNRLQITVDVECKI